MGLPGTRALLPALLFKVLFKPFLFFSSSPLSKAAEKQQKEPAMAEEGRERSVLQSSPPQGRPQPRGSARQGRGVGPSLPGSFSS